ncbi:MAG: transketolase C-terminal domain-containing protein [Candidatus Cloacimonadia bacterium]|jgi:transketolase
MIPPFKKGEILPIRDGYGKALLDLASTNPDIIVLDADLSASTRSNWFAEKYPERFVNVGIAEQNLVCVAAGLSLTGKIPFVTTYAVFVVGRAFDQIRNTVCFSNLNVKIVGSHGGLSVGPDGGSHQAIEDIALMNALPNMTLLCPVDANEAWQMTIKAAELKTPVYIRLAREATEIITDHNYTFELGKAQSLRKGGDGYLLFHSVIGSEVMKAADILSEKGLNFEVVNFSTIKPIDTELLNRLAASDKPLFVIEEHLLNGGLTSIISTYFSLNTPRKLYSISLDDIFGESGSPQDLYEAYGFSAEQIANRVIQTIS